MCLRMQALSLGEASLPRHLHTALFTQSTDNRLLTHRFVLSDVLNCSQLSRHLVALWCEQNETAKALLQRLLVRPSVAMVMGSVSSWGFICG